MAVAATYTDILIDVSNNYCGGGCKPENNTAILYDTNAGGGNLHLIGGTIGANLVVGDGTRVFDVGVNWVGACGHACSAQMEQWNGTSGGRVFSLTQQGETSARRDDETAALRAEVASLRDELRALSEHVRTLKSDDASAAMVRGFAMLTALVRGAGGSMDLRAGFLGTVHPSIRPAATPPTALGAGACVNLTCPTGKSHLYGGVDAGFYCCPESTASGDCSSPACMPGSNRTDCACCIFPGHSSGCQGAAKCIGSPPNTSTVCPAPPQPPERSVQAAFGFGQAMVYNTAETEGGMSLKQSVLYHCHNASVNQLSMLIAPPTEGGVISNPKDDDPWQPVVKNVTGGFHGNVGMVQAAARFSRMARTTCPQATGVVIDDFLQQYIGQNDTNGCVNLTCPAGQSYMYGSKESGFYCCPTAPTGGGDCGSADHKTPVCSKAGEAHCVCCVFPVRLKKLFCIQKLTQVPKDLFVNRARPKAARAQAGAKAPPPTRPIFAGESTTPCIINLSRICFSLLPSALNYRSTVAICVCPAP